MKRTQNEIEELEALPYLTPLLAARLNELKANLNPRNAAYRFHSMAYKALRDSVVIQLRKDGFSAYSEYDCENRNEILVTNATPSQVRIAAGLGWIIHD